MITDITTPSLFFFLYRELGTLKQKSVSLKE